MRERFHYAKEEGKKGMKGREGERGRRREGKGDYVEGGVNRLKGR